LQEAERGLTQRLFAGQGMSMPAEKSVPILRVLLPSLEEDVANG